jgi:glucose/arabinose dehydrogenase
LKTRFIYVYYNFNKNGNCDEDPFNGPVNRLSRFILPESFIVDMSTETVFFETPSLEYDHHNAGDIAFGNDGYLYVSVGDGGSTFSGVAQNPGNLFGSMIRLTQEGLPPAGSPEGAKCQEIFAIGLRNPFRFSMDPNTEDDKVRLYFNDVGQAVWEEISKLPMTMLVPITAGLYAKGRVLIARQKTVPKRTTTRTLCISIFTTTAAAVL